MCYFLLSFDGMTSGLVILKPGLKNNLDHFRPLRLSILKPANSNIFRRNKLIKSRSDCFSDFLLNNVTFFNYKRQLCTCTFHRTVITTNHIVTHFKNFIGMWAVIFILVSIPLPSSTTTTVNSVQNNTRLQTGSKYNW